MIILITTSNRNPRDMGRFRVIQRAEAPPLEHDAHSCLSWPDVILDDKTPLPAGDHLVTRPSVRIPFIPRAKWPVRFTGAHYGVRVASADLLPRT